MGFYCNVITQTCQEWADTMPGNFSAVAVANAIGAWQLSNNRPGEYPENAETLSKFIADLKDSEIFASTAIPYYEEGTYSSKEYLVSRRPNSPVLVLHKFSENATEAANQKKAFFDALLHKYEILKLQPEKKQIIDGLRKGQDGYTYAFELYREAYHIRHNTNRNDRKADVEAIVYALNTVSQYAKKMKKKAEPVAQSKAVEVRKKIEKYIDWTRKHVKFDDATHTYYLDGKPVTYSVTQYGRHLRNKEDKPNKEYDFASALGRVVDKFARNFFTGSLQTIYPTLGNQDSADYIDLKSQLKKLKTLLHQKYGNFEVITAEFPLVTRLGDNETLAGTMDMLIVDELGQLHILDFKVKNHAWKEGFREIGETQTEDEFDYNFQQNAYREMIQAIFPDLNADIDMQLIWFNTSYPKPDNKTAAPEGLHYSVDDNGNIMAQAGENNSHNLKLGVYNLSRLPGYEKPSLPTTIDPADPEGERKVIDGDRALIPITRKQVIPTTITPVYDENAPAKETKQWAVTSDNGFELNTKGTEFGQKFSAYNATFKKGTFYDGVDVSGQTIEYVYQNIVKKSRKGQPPAQNSRLFNPSLTTKQEQEDYSYYQAYLPLWQIWALQNMGLVRELAKRSEGKVLTDQDAKKTTVNQARALADIINSLDNINTNIVSVTQQSFTRASVKENPRTLYIFTDNTDRTSGRGTIDSNSWYAQRYGQGLHYPTTTSACIRGLDNARPISTQKKYVPGKNSSDGNWKVEDFEEFKRTIDAEIEDIIAAWNTGQYDSIKIVDIFKGKISNISNNPTFMGYLTSRLLDLERRIAFGEYATQSTQTSPVTDGTPLEAHFEESTGDYAVRTGQNIQNSDVTIQLATDFETLGEKRTLAEANKQGKPIIQHFLTGENNDDASTIAQNIYNELRKKNLTENISLNVAGNGIYTLSQSQEYYNDLMKRVLQALIAKGVTFREVRSGGQTGIDEAGVIAARDLGLNWKVVAPNGWKFRPKNGKDISNKTAFMSRFGDTTELTYILPSSIYSSKKAILTKGTVVKGVTLPQTMTINDIMSYQPFLDTRIDFSKKYKSADMSFSYWVEKPGGGTYYKRWDVQSRDTISAIIAGERTATTRYLTSEESRNFWTQVKPGEIIRFAQHRNGKETQAVFVRVKSITPVTQDTNKEEWSKKEGWNPAYFEEFVLPRLTKGEEALQIEFEFLTIDSAEGKENQAYNDYKLLWETWLNQNPASKKTLEENGKETPLAFPEGRTGKFNEASVLSDILGLQTASALNYRHIDINNTFSRSKAVDTFLTSVSAPVTTETTSDTGTLPEIGDQFVDVNTESDIFKLNQAFTPIELGYRIESITRQFSRTVTVLVEEYKESLQEQLEEEQNRPQEEKDEEEISRLKNLLNGFDLSDKPRKTILMSMDVAEIYDRMKQEWQQLAAQSKEAIESHFGEGTYETIHRKYQNVVDNFERLVDKALPNICRAENIDITIEKKELPVGDNVEEIVTGTITESEEEKRKLESDNDDADSGERALGNDGWSYKVRMVDPFETRSEATRSVLREILRVHPNGKIAMTDLDEPRYMDDRAAYTSLQDQLTSMIDADDFVNVQRDSSGNVIIDEDTGYPLLDEENPFPALSKASVKYPWIEQVIEILQDNPELIGSFFCDFRKDFISYWMMHTKTEKDPKTGELKEKMVPFELNKPSAQEGTMTLVTRAYEQGEILDEDSIYSEVGELKADKAALGVNLVEELRNHLQAGVLDNEVTEISQKFEKVLNMCGFNVSRPLLRALIKSQQEVEGEAQYADLFDVIDNLRIIFSTISEGKEISSDAHLTDYFKTSFKKIANVVGTVSELEIAISFRIGKDTMQSYSSPNYASTVIKKLASAERSKEFIDSTYAPCAWFCQQTSDGKKIWRNELLRLIYQPATSALVRQHLRVGELIRIDQSEYAKWQPSQLRRAYINNFYSQGIVKGQKLQFGTYGFPMLSDASVAMTITMVKYVDDTSGTTVKTVQDQILPLLVRVAYQELDRISLCMQRRLQGITPIANFDEGKGEQFQFFPALNKKPVVLDGQNMTFLDAVIALSRDGRKSELKALIEDNIKQVVWDSCNKFREGFSDAEREEMASDLINSGVISSEEGLDKALNDYYWNNAFAQSQLIQIMTTDLAFYSHTIDFQKRFKEVYSAGIKLNTNSRYGKKFEHVIYCKDFLATSPTYSDLRSSLNQAVTSGRIQSFDRDNILYKFRNICSTDAQAYRNLPSFRSLLDMLNLWTPGMEEALKRLEAGTWDMADFNVVWQTIKPFMYTQVLKPDGVNENGKILVPHQNKNSEFLLLAFYNLVAGGAKQSPVLRGIDRAMRDGNIDLVQMESGGKVGVQGAIDITFSPQKVQNYLNGLINEKVKRATLKAAVRRAITSDMKKKYAEVVVSDANKEKWKAKIEEKIKKKLNKLTDNELIKQGLDQLLIEEKISQEEYNKIIRDLIPSENEVYNIIMDAIFNGNSQTNEQDGYNGRQYNIDVVHTFSYDDYVVQQPNPAHLKDTESVVGSQSRNLIISDLPEKFEVKVQGRTYKKKELIRLFMAVTTANLLDDYQEVSGKFIDVPALSAALKKLVAGNARYGRDFLDAIEVVYIADPSNNNKLTPVFNLPLDNPSITLKIQELITSMFKNAIAKQYIKGAACTLVSDFGFTYDLQIEYRKKGDVTSGVKCVQCYLPATSKKFLQAFIDPETGRLDINDIPEELRRAIGFRIPTENKYSMVPLRIMGFLPEQNGSSIMLPMDITQQSGSDFDIDKLFMMLHEFYYQNTYDMTGSSGKGGMIRAFVGALDKIEGAEHLAREISVEDTEDLISDFKAWMQSKRNEDWSTEREEFLNNTDSISQFLLFLKDYNADWAEEFSKYFTQWSRRSGARRRYKKATKIKKVMYNHDSSPLEQSRAARNNLMIDIAQAILTSPEMAHIVAHPGNYDKLKMGAYIGRIINNPKLLSIFQRVYGVNTVEQTVKKLLSLSRSGNLTAIKSFIEEYSEPLDPLSIDTFVYFHKQNMTGKALTAMYANNTTMQAKFQNSNLGIRIPIRVNGKEYASLHDIYSPEGELISFNCAETSAASVDNAKDPVLADLLQNPRTANLMGTMLRLGFTIEFISALFTNSTVRQCVSPNGSLNFKGVIIELQKALTKKVRNNDLRTAYQTENFTTEMVMRDSLTQITAGMTDEQIVQIQFTRLKILQMLDYLKSVSEEVGELTRISRADSPKGGIPKSIAAVKLRLRQVELFIRRNSHSRSLLTGVDTCLQEHVLTLNQTKQEMYDTLMSKPMAMLQAFHSLGVELPMELLTPFFSQVSELADDCLRFIMDNCTKGNFENYDGEKKINTFYKALITFALSNTKMFGENYEAKREYFLYEFPAEFLKLKKDPELAKIAVLQKIEVAGGKLIMRRSGRLTADQRASLQRDLDLLLLNHPELATKLLMYCYYQDGLGFTPDGFSFLFSSVFISQFPEIVNTLRDLPRTIGRGDKWGHFIAQFYANNPTYAALIKVNNIVADPTDASIVVLPTIQVQSTITGNPRDIIQLNVQNSTGSEFSGVYVLVEADASNARYKRVPMIQDLYDGQNIKYNINESLSELAAHTIDKKKVRENRNLHNKVSEDVAAEATTTNNAYEQGEQLASIIPDSNSEPDFGDNDDLESQVPDAVVNADNNLELEEQAEKAGVFNVLFDEDKAEQDSQVQAGWEYGEDQENQGGAVASEDGSDLEGKAATTGYVQDGVESSDNKGVCPPGK